MSKMTIDVNNIGDVRIGLFENQAAKESNPTPTASMPTEDLRTYLENISLAILYAPVLPIRILELQQ